MTMMNRAAVWAALFLALVLPTRAAKAHAEGTVADLVEAAFGPRSDEPEKFGIFENHEDDHHEPGHACLFPSLILMVGLVVYYILSR